MAIRFLVLVQLFIFSACALAILSASASAIGLSLVANWTGGPLLTMADLDGDLTKEIISTSNNISVYVWYLNGTSFPGWPVQADFDVVAISASGDLNNDGTNEVVFGTRSGNLYAYSDNGTLLWVNDNCSSIDMGSIDSSPVLADLDGNWNLDILFSCNTLFSSSLYALDISGNPLPGWEMPKMTDGVVVGSPAASDIDGDGINDVIVNGWLGMISPFFVQVFYGNGSYEMLYSETDSSIQPASSPMIGDFDGDGKEEIFVEAKNFTDSAGIQSRAYLIENDSSTIITADLASTGYPSQAISADLNNDSIAEIILKWDDGMNRTISVFNGSLSQIWSYVLDEQPSSFAEYYIYPTVGDINNDANPEVLVPSGERLVILSESGSLLINKDLQSLGFVGSYAIGTPLMESNRIIFSIENSGLYSTYVYYIDMISPQIFLSDPQNATYTAMPIPLSYSAADDIAVGSVWYSIDGGSNVTLYGNTTFSLQNGFHNLTLYTNDTAGNTNSTTTEFSVACTESWSCSDWSAACSGGSQSRTCADSNSCGTVQSKPVETQSCSSSSGSSGGGGGYYCQTNWTCTTFFSCQPDGTQSRNCTDANKCLVPFNKPAEKQNCTYTPSSAPSEIKLPICGDGKCDSNESCSSCPKDCGACPVQNETAAENSTKGEITGQFLAIPALDYVIIALIVVLSAVFVIAIKK